MKVYIDILLIENFVINFYLLLITLQVTKTHIKYWKLFLSAVIGSLYTLCIVIPSMNVFTLLPFKLSISFLMIFVCCYKNGIVDCIKKFIVFIVISFLLCGVIAFISFYENDYSISDGITINNISSKYAILAVMITYIVCFRIVKYIKDKIVFSKLIYLVQIQYKNDIVSFKGFLDTGNELIEPVTMLPVILVEHNLVDNMISNNKNLYIVKYSTVSGSEGYLKGFIPDRISIKGGDTAIEKRAVICPCYEKLSSCNEYKALISRGLL